MIEPLICDDALVRDIDGADPGAGLAIWWLGQSGFLVAHGGHRLLFDPYLSDSLTRKYSGSDKPHVRMTARAIAPEALTGIDVVTSTHNHTDHLDAETLLPLLSANPDVVIVVPEANRDFAAKRLGTPRDRLTGLDDGTSLSVGPFKVHGVPAAHEEVDRDEEGRCRYLGYVVTCGDHVLYHSGDTVRYDSMAERLAAFDIDVAFLPINGRRPERRVPGNLFGDEAARLARDAGIRLAIPCHFEMFEFNHERPDLFVETCRELGQGYRVLACGERLEIPPPRLPTAR